MEHFEGRVAIVTGAASGIGRATALAFARRGAKVTVADVRTDEGAETAEQVEAAGGEAAFVPCDVRVPSSVEGMVKTTLGTFGRLDYAFNGAGVPGRPSPTTEGRAEDWDDVIDTNLKGVWLCMKYQIREMLKKRFGVVVNCASVGGVVGVPGMSAYVASKHGVLGLTRSAAIEYGAFGIRVNAVCPSGVDTPMLRGMIGDDLESEARRNPMGRLGRPDEIAAAVLWLCSEQASFVNGHSMMVDGGYVAQ